MKCLTGVFAQVVLLFVFALLPGSYAFWRMPCLHFDGYYRLDPVVSPGKLSEHAHAIHGSSGFGMNSSYDDLISGSCTSCAVTQDKSAYWVPPLMFQHADGTIESVPVLTFLAYYFLNGDNIQSFPPGFRMISGSNSRRDFTLPLPIPPQSFWGPADMTQEALEQKAIGFNCLHYNSGDEGSLGRHFLPSKAFIDANCHNGLRLELAFPSCWNGKDVDSHDHKSHVAYSDFVINGACPEGFPVRLPTIFFEHYYDTTVFKGARGNFIMGNNDQTGYGYHGDFAMGWNPNFLQQAINTCTSLSGMIENCPLFNIDYKAPQSCNMKAPNVAVAEKCAGPRPGLCGNFDKKDVEIPSPIVPPTVQRPAAPPVQKPVAPPPAQKPVAPPTVQKPVALPVQMPVVPAPPPPPPALTAAPRVHTVVDWVTELVDETVTQYAKRSVPTGAPVRKNPKFFYN